MDVRSLVRRVHTECAQIPQAVVNSGDLSTVLGVADLSEEDGGSHLGQTVAEAKEQSTGDVH
jgi:hypothetical protein